MEQMNCYRLLGISAIGHVPSVEVTDKLVEEKYLKVKTSLLGTIEEVKNNSGNYQRIKKLKDSLEKIEYAYNTLKTEEDRANYELKHVKKKMMNIKISHMLDDSEIETVTVNKDNKALGVRKEQLDLKYDVKYYDEDVVIMEAGKIRFLNAGVIDQDLTRYFMIMQKQKDLEAYLHEFYSRIYLSKMQEKEYREALYSAINKSIREERSYVGAVEKVGENYKEVWDDGEYDAVQKYEQAKRKSYVKEKGAER